MQNYLSAVELGYRLPDGRFLFNNLTFSFSAVRAGLVGANGIGKTTLIEILAGKREPSVGAVNRCGRVSYLPQQALPQRSRTRLTSPIRSARSNALSAAKETWVISI
jgi:ATPase subunit of ABC transporter with duplicated ATPase domains